MDGEHTYDAALQDARFCRSVLRGEGVIAFHDFDVVDRAIAAFLREIPTPAHGYLLRDQVIVVELGETSLLGSPAVRAQLQAPRRVWLAANRLGLVPQLIEACYLRSARRVLRRAFVVPFKRLRRLAARR